MQHKTVRDLMVKNLVFLDPEDTLEDAAIEMMEANCSILPVGTRSSVKGIITDRDIIIRSVAQGKDSAREKVREHMTLKACFCNETDSISQAANIMLRNKISRLIVKNSEGKASGVLSLGHIFGDDEERHIAA